MNQYLSGLAFTLDPELDTYLWWGHCTNLSAGYVKVESVCWTSDIKLAQGSNGSLSMPGERMVMDRIRIDYEDYLINEFYRTRWSFVVCLVIDGTCSECIPFSYYVCVLASALARMLSLLPGEILHQLCHVLLFGEKASSVLIFISNVLNTQL